MSFNNINTKLRSERGFTIVELLIVIVVIGILAAITIVSFNGVTARANTSSAQAAASTTLKKVEAYNAENSAYPTSFSNLTASSASSSSFYLTGVTFTTTASGGAGELTGSTKPGSPSTLNFYSCGGSGIQVKYFNYSTNAWVAQITGTCTTPTYVAS